MQNIMPIRPPEKLKEWLKKEAKEQGFTVNGLILNILWDYYKKEENQILSERKRTGGEDK